MLKRAVAYALVIAGGLAAVPIRAEILEQVLVKVNGDMITKTEFETRQVQELRNRPNLANASPTSPELQKAIAEITPDLILDAVDRLLMVQRGRELGFAMSDDTFRNVLDNIKKQNNIATDEQFQQALRESGMTLPDMRQEIERNMLEQRVQQTDVMDKISVTEEEAHSYYDTHRNEFTTPSELTLREISSRCPRTSAASTSRPTMRRVKRPRTCTIACSQGSRSRASPQRYPQPRPRQMAVWSGR